MKYAFSAFLTVVATIAIALFSGCETTPAQKEADISPSSASVRYGQSVTFTASGGYDYEWSLSQESYGTLSSRTGNQTTFRSLYSPTASNAVTITLTLTSTILGSPTDNTTTNTSTSAYQTTSEAYITLLSTNS